MEKEVKTEIENKVILKLKTAGFELLELEGTDEYISNSLNVQPSLHCPIGWPLATCGS